MSHRANDTVPRIKPKKRSDGSTAAHLCAELPLQDSNAHPRSLLCENAAWPPWTAVVSSRLMGMCPAALGLNGWPRRADERCFRHRGNVAGFRPASRNLHFTKAFAVNLPNSIKRHCLQFCSTSCSTNP